MVTQKRNMGTPYTCPNPEDEPEAYLINGRWYVDVEVEDSLQEENEE